MCANRLHNTVIHLHTEIKPQVRRHINRALLAMVRTNTKEDEAKKWDGLFEEFEGLYNRLSDENKRIMMNYPLLETEEDVNRCMGFMRFMILFQVMREDKA